MRLQLNRTTLPLLVLAVLAGCGKGGDTSAQATPTPVPGPAASSALPEAAARPAAPAPGVARKVEDKNDTFEFGYGYPAQAGGIPALKTMLDAELAKLKADLASEAGEGRADAKKDGYPFHAYSTDKQWSLVTDLPGWLSLSATIYDYSGGAHGMTVFDTLLWDKRAKVRREPLALFATKAAFSAATAKPLCAALDRERRKRREGEDVTSDDMFGKCIDPVDDTTIILGSSDHRRFDRVGFLIGPYTAGPYAEGTYELTLPVTPALIAAVRPEYRDAFAPS